jgi:hypothetical protein
MLVRKRKGKGEGNKRSSKHGVFEGCAEAVCKEFLDCACFLNGFTGNGFSAGNDANYIGHE